MPSQWDRSTISVATKEISISFDELSRLEVYCLNCDSAILLKMESPGGPGYLEQCAVCGVQLNEKLKGAVVTYKRFFAAASEVKAKILFRVKAD